MRKFLLLTFIFSLSAFAEGFGSSETVNVEKCMTIQTELEQGAIGLNTIRRDKAYKIDVAMCGTPFIDLYKESLRKSIILEKRQIREMNKEINQVAYNSNR